jgi:hypothetical protein
MCVYPVITLYFANSVYCILLFIQSRILAQTFYILPSSQSHWSHTCFAARPNLAAGCAPGDSKQTPSLTHSHHLTSHTLTTTFIHSLTLSLYPNSYLPLIWGASPLHSLPKTTFSDSRYPSSPKTNNNTRQENQHHVRKGHRLRHSGRRRARCSRSPSRMPSGCRQVRCAPRAHNTHGAQTDSPQRVP